MMPTRIYRILIVLLISSFAFAAGQDITQNFLGSDRPTVPKDPIASVSSVGTKTEVAPSPDSSLAPSPDALTPTTTGLPEDPIMAKAPSPDLPDAEQKLLDEEYSPPKEAPYVNEEVPQNPTTPDAQPYNASLEPPTPYDISGLKKVTAKGEYIFEVPASPQYWAITFRMGPFSPPKLANRLDSGEISFADVYGKSPNLMFGFLLENQFFKGFGKLALRIGSGLYTAHGKGRFKSDATKVAREGYTFYLFPNSADLIYRLDYVRNQLFVPYAYAGGYYFTFIESRDDNTPAKYGGAPAVKYGGGLALRLNGLDRTATNQLDADFGINNIFLYGDYENIIGASTTFDFSNSVITGGVIVEF